MHFNSHMELDLCFRLLNGLLICLRYRWKRSDEGFDDILKISGRFSCYSQVLNGEKSI